MAYDDTFKPRYYLHEKETFELLGKPRRIREVRPNNFAGPVAEWADYRTAVYEDKVIPVMTFPEQLGNDVHRVAWVNHSGYDFETGQDYAQHHIVCDCCLMAEISGEPDSIYECSTLQKTLKRRASFLRSTLMLDKILRACTDSEDGRLKVTLDRRFFAAETIMWLLHQDREHPESWMGNIVSGEHNLSLLGLILQQPPGGVRLLVEDLAEEGRVEFDGEYIVALTSND